MDEQETIFDKISEEDFARYEEVRESGVTNMFDFNTVRLLSGLSHEKILLIIQNYTDLHDHYLGGMSGREHE